MSNMLTVQEFKEIFYEWNTNHFKYKDFEKLYEELKMLNTTQLKDLIRAFNGAIYVYEELISNNNQQFNDKFKADTKDLIKAHNTNMLFLHFSPLLERLYFHYIYIHYFREQNKELQELKNEIENAAITKNLTGIGIGMGLQTKNGLLRLAIANNHAKKQQFEIYNTITHISYNVKF